MKNNLETQFEEAKKYANSAVRDVEGTARDLKSSAENKFNEAYDSAKNIYGDLTSKASKHARQAARYTEEMVHEKPFTSLLTAAGVGLVAGYLMGCRRK